MRTIISIALAIWLPFQGMAQTTDNCSLDFPADVEAPLWLDDFDTCDPNIRRFIEYRLFGLEFYAPALEQLSRLNHAEQLEIIESFRAKSGPYDALKQDLSLPMSLIETILREAEAGGADTDWDIPAFEEVLLELRGTGKPKVETHFQTYVILLQPPPDRYISPLLWIRRGKTTPKRELL